MTVDYFIIFLDIRGLYTNPNTLNTYFHFDKTLDQTSLSIFIPLKTFFFKLPPSQR